MRGSLMRLVILAGLVASYAVNAEGQTANVIGKVTDETGGVLPGVSISARNEETGLHPHCGQ